MSDIDATRTGPALHARKLDVADDVFDGHALAGRPGMPRRIEAARRPLPSHGP